MIRESQPMKDAAGMAGCWVFPRLSQLAGLLRLSYDWSSTNCICMRAMISEAFVDIFWASGSCYVLESQNLVRPSSYALGAFSLVKTGKEAGNRVWWVLHVGAHDSPEEVLHLV